MGLPVPGNDKVASSGVRVHVGALLVVDRALEERVAQSARFGRPSGKLAARRRGFEARRGVERSGRPAIASMMTQSGAAFLPGVVSGPLARPGGSARDRARAGTGRGAPSRTRRQRAAGSYSRC